jgi:hypothetical protein
MLFLLFSSQLTFPLPLLTIGFVVAQVEVDWEKIKAKIQAEKEQEQSGDGVH